MWLLQVLPLQKVLLCHLLRALTAPTGPAAHGTGPNGPAGTCVRGLNTPGSCSGAWQTWQLGGGTSWTLSLLFTQDICSQIGW